MAKKRKKKNKLLPIIILAILLVALTVGYVLLSNYNAKKAQEEAAGQESSAVEVLHKNKAILTEFSYTLDEGTLSFSYVNDKWIYPGDTTFPVDSKAVASMVAGMTDIKAVSVVDKDGADVDSFGLSKPERVITAKYSDGTEYTFNFGIVNSYNNHQYMTYTGSGDIYMMESSFAGGFSKDLKYFFEDEVWKLENDAITASDVTSVVLTTLNGKSNTVEHDEAVSELFNLMNELDLSAWEDHYADETEKAELYGINEEGDRVTLNYLKETTVTDSDGKQTKVEVPDSYTVYFGREFEIVEDEEDKKAEDTATDSEAEGTESEEAKKLYFFYTPKGSDVIYSAEKEKADAIFDYMDYVAPEEDEAEAEK